VATLAGPMVGAAANIDVVGTRWMDRPPNKGDLFLAIRADAFTDVGAWTAAQAQQLDAMVATAPGFHRPGTGRRLRAVATDSGLPVSARLRHLIEPGHRDPREMP